MTNEGILVGICSHINLIANGLGGGLGGDIAAAFGDLFELAKQEAQKYLSGETLARALKTIKLLMQNGLPKHTACAAVGVFLSENNCRPDSCCQKEKDGGGTPGTGGSGYGAGIASWTHQPHKNNVLALIGKPAGTAIETLSLEDQCQMYAKELNSYKSRETVQKMLSGTIEEATVAAMFFTHGDARSTLKQHGYTYKAAYEEQLAQTPRLMNFAKRSTPSVHHKTGLLVRIILGNQLYGMV